MNKNPISLICLFLWDGIEGNLSLLIKIWGLFLNFYVQNNHHMLSQVFDKINFAWLEEKNMETNVLPARLLFLSN